MIKRTAATAESPQRMFAKSAMIGKTPEADNANLGSTDTALLCAREQGR
jgi:hypothetical protein